MPRFHRIPRVTFANNKIEQKPWSIVPNDVKDRIIPTLYHSVDLHPFFQIPVDTEKVDISDGRALYPARDAWLEKKD
jgi:hypothetical protein